MGRLRSPYLVSLSWSHSNTFSSIIWVFHILFPFSNLPL